MTSKESSASASLPEGYLVAGRYRVERLVGRGGMGAVFSVLDEQLGRRVALKLLLTAHAGDAQLVERFQREARITASVRHPGIVEVLDHGTHAGLFYLVMEWLVGENLERRLERAGPQSPAFVSRVGTELCRALASAHAVGVVHRDITPGNIYLAEVDGHHDVVKLLDFGIAKLLAHEGAESLTRSNQVIGTLAYMSPEQLSSSKQVTPASDVYALGSVLYEMLIGRPPFVAASQAALGLAIMQNPPRTIESLRADVPPALSAAIARALEKLPGARFHDAGELADTLAHIAEQLGGPSAPSGPFVLDDSPGPVFEVTSTLVLTNAHTTQSEWPDEQRPSPPPPIEPAPETVPPQVGPLQLRAESAARKSPKLWLVVCSLALLLLVCWLLR